ncbi:MAG: HAMP domain-containing sensor histidine kinase [Bacteroidales bacterium]
MHINSLHTQTIDTTEICNNCGVPIWYEDASELYAELSRIENTFGSIEKYITYHPHIIPALIDRIKVIDVNNEAMTFFEAEKRELCKGIRHFFANETYSRFFQMIMHLYAGNLSYTYITSKYSTKGQKFITQITVTIPEKYKDNWTRMIVTEVDVSHFLKREVKAKREFELQKREADNYKKFASIVSHELKNPFNTLMGFSEILLTKFNSLSQDKMLEYIQYIHESAHQSYQLFNNVLDWTKNTHDTQSPMSVSLSEIVAGVLELVQAACFTKHIHIFTDIDANLFIYVNPHTLAFVLRNVITNAIKFSYPDSEISITAEAANGYVYIQVLDFGIGMNQPSQSNSESVHTAVNNDTGTGIGLQLSTKFIEQQGGYITFDSEQDCGTCVTIVLPEKEHTHD